ncbi:zinc ribbon domain-containing protein [Deinococcus sp. YIM 134068]|uniref:zinc ribbon domain-containing protein n=1 Tax=Deinococcus lichenicola TaxID=3118910 RepID=UPI002F94F1E5
MPNTLISASTPLHPTSTQAQALGAMWSATQGLHLTVRGWLRAVGRGLHLHVREAFWQVSDGHLLPRVDDHRLIDIRLDALHQLSQVTHADLPPPWQRAIPGEVLQRLLDIEVRRLQPFGHGVRAGRALPLLPLSRLALDAAARPVDAHHVLIAGLSEPVVADVWSLPDDIAEALLVEADEQVARAAALADVLKSRVLCGDTGAASELYRLHQTAWPWLGRQPKLTRDPDRPHRYQHVSLVQQAGGLALDWTVRVPAGYLPPARRGDGFGVDLGYRRVVTAASAAGVTSVERRAEIRAGLPAPADDARALYVDSTLRRCVLDAHREELEALLRQALTHTDVNIEAINWAGIRDRGGAPWAAEAMALLGAPTFTRWLRMLAPASGTRVHLIDPAGTSRTCWRCGGAGERPWPYTHFHCPACGTWTDADHNSAALIRQRVPGDRVVN